MIVDWIVLNQVVLGLISSHIFIALYYLFKVSALMRLVTTLVRMMLEVETLKYATQATVSRCGMVWFSTETLSNQMLYHHYLCRLQQDVYDSVGDDPDTDNYGNQYQ